MPAPDMRGRFGDLLSVEVSGANLSKQEENSLVKRSQKFESGETGVQEFHRLTSFQMPTLALAGHCDYPLAGYKTLLRYLKATGFKGEVRKCHIESTLDTFGSKMVFNRTMRVPIRILGVKQLAYIDYLIYPKVEQDDFVMKVGNFAMHLDEACETVATGKQIFNWTYPDASGDITPDYYKEYEVCKTCTASHPESPSTISQISSPPSRAPCHHRRPPSAADHHLPPPPPIVPHRSTT